MKRTYRRTGIDWSDPKQRKAYKMRYMRERRKYGGISEWVKILGVRVRIVSKP